MGDDIAGLVQMLRIAAVFREGEPNSDAELMTEAADALDRFRWRSVEEELPEEDGPYLVLRRENKFPTTRLYYEGDWVSSATIAAWMPMPRALAQG